MKYNSAGEEMRAAWKELKTESCKDCANREGNYCKLTTRRRKCDPNGKACMRFVRSERYRFVVR